MGFNQFFVNHANMSFENTRSGTKIFGNYYTLNTTIIIAIGESNEQDCDTKDQLQLYNISATLVLQQG